MSFSIMLRHRMSQSFDWQILRLDKDFRRFGDPPLPAPIPEGAVTVLLGQTTSLGLAS